MRITSVVRAFEIVDEIERGSDGRFRATVDARTVPDGYYCISVSDPKTGGRQSLKIDPCDFGVPIAHILVTLFSARAA